MNRARRSIPFQRARFPFFAMRALAGPASSIAHDFVVALPDVDAGTGAGAAGSDPWIAAFAFLPLVARATRVAAALALPSVLDFRGVFGVRVGVKPKSCSFGLVGPYFACKYRFIPARRSRPWAMAAF